MPQPEKRRNLGRGLSALIPPKPEADAAAPSMVSGRGLKKLPIEEVLPSDAQPRQLFDEDGIEELAQSIKTHGILQPIVVRQRAPGQFEIVAGERRWRAAQRAGLKEIEAVISEVAEQDTLTLALVENLQRRDLNAIEEAEAYQRLHKELGYSQGEIAEAVGKDRSTVANSLRLLKLPLSVRELVLNGSISMGHARALLALESDADIERLARKVMAGGLSVRDTERAVQGEKEEPAAKKKRAAAKETQAERDVRMRLQRALGTRVELRHRDGKGTFTVHFGSYDELDRLLAQFGA
jgi:ParB family chromosome partitioning protein